MIKVDLDISRNVKLTREEISYIKKNNLIDFIQEIINNEASGNKLLNKALLGLKKPKIYISIFITDNLNIHNINKQYRNIDKETDVISFAFLDEEDDIYNNLISLGEIIISIEKVRKQAKDFNHGIKREIYYLICHSLLHLLGYNHINNKDKLKMRKKEEEYLKNYRR